MTNEAQIAKARVKGWYPKAIICRSILYPEQEFRVLPGPKSYARPTCSNVFSASEDEAWIQAWDYIQHCASDKE
jgi:hypothetical protein